MSVYLPARQTTYKGIAMRSRLEARFAAFLDSCGIPWIYEPRAYASPAGQYLPDFQILLPRTRLIFTEVKPTMERAYRAMARMQIIWESEPDALLTIAIDGGLVFRASGSGARLWSVAFLPGWAA